jgi:Bifunctional DNA primase/polymerase, N-terminal
MDQHAFVNGRKASNSTGPTHARISSRVLSAISWAKRGAKPIPLIDDELAFRGAHSTTDPDEIQEWWGKHLDYDVGIETGKMAGIAVLDCTAEGMENIRMYLDP